MLPDRYRELVASYVDGELTNRQRKAVQRLLQRSAEARDLLRRMQQDADTLRRLPRQRPILDLSDSVLQLIAQQNLKPARGRRRSRSPASNGIPIWAAVSAAAAVLIAVGIGSYLYFATPAGPPETQRVADGSPDGQAAQARPDEKTAAAPGTPDEKDKDKRPPDEPLKAAPRHEGPKPAPREDSPKPPPVVEAAPPDPVDGMEMFRPADVKLATIHKFADLDGDPGRQKLQAELRKDSGFRLEVPCRDSVKAFERLQAALKSAGLSLVLDPNAAARIQMRAKYPKLKTNFVVYIEDLTHEELTALLQQAAGEDRKAEARHKGAGQLEAVVVNALTAADREELCKLVGVAAKQLPAPPAGPLGADVRKPLSDKTSDEIAKALKGQGATPRPDPAKPVAKGPEHLALALPYNPVRPRAGAAEVKRFLDARRPARPGTVAVLIVLRDTGA